MTAAYADFVPEIGTGVRVYVAGMTGIGGGAAEEARDALGKIGSTLAGVSLDLKDVENIWVYLADVRDWDAVRAVLDQTLGADGREPAVVGSRLMG